VQGKMAVAGKFVDGIQDIRLPFGQKAAAKPTSTMKLAGNLDASAPVMLGQVTDTTTTPPTRAAVDPMSSADRALPENAKSYVDTSITVFDSVGTKHDLKVTLWKTSQDASGSQWSMRLDTADMAAAGITDAQINGGSTYALSFGTDGVLQSPVPATVSFTPPGAETVSVALDFGEGANGISSYATTSSAVLRDQDGYTAGTLQSFSIDRTGTITGSFTNGTTEALGQIVLADFNNPSGLLRTGDNMYGVSGNSGGAVLGYALEGSQSMITSGALEMSNVDLAQEFTSMIVAQRGYQANSKVITTSDEMLQELMNLKR